MKTDNTKSLTGCLIGTAIGDAMGLSTEGLSRQRLIKMYPKRDQYHFLWHRGMVSDDTEQTCLVAQALIYSGGNVERFKTYLAWQLRYWLLALPAAVGWATLKAILKLWLGFSADRSGVFSAGNGPAMRSALIGVYHGHDPKQLKAFVRASTRLTHTDPKAEWGALAVALAAHLAHLEQTISPTDYLAQLQQLLLTEAQSQEFIALIQKTIDHLDQSTLDFAQNLGLHHGVSGYVYHTVPVVLHVWLRNQDNYSQAILEIIRCGGDTDTTAAIVGGIIGARVGPEGIPELWQNHLWEFPRTLSWMKRLGQQLNQSRCQGIPQSPLSVSFVMVFLRNLIFLLIVLWHGFRRLLPPYVSSSVKE